MSEEEALQRAIRRAEMGESIAFIGCTHQHIDYLKRSLPEPIVGAYIKTNAGGVVRFCVPNNRYSLRGIKLDWVFWSDHTGIYRIIPYLDFFELWDTEVCPSYVGCLYDEDPVIFFRPYMQIEKKTRFERIIHWEIH